MRIGIVVIEYYQAKFTATIVIITGIVIPMPMMTRQPPPVIMRPIFCCRPLLVRGIPIDLEILDFAAEIPTNRFHENPPKFILLALAVV